MGGKNFTRSRQKLDIGERLATRSGRFATYASLKVSVIFRKKNGDRIN
jgi:hypothetical protein